MFIRSSLRKAKSQHSSNKLQSPKKEKETYGEKPFFYRQLCEHIESMQWELPGISKGHIQMKITIDKTKTRNRQQTDYCKIQIIYLESSLKIICQNVEKKFYESEMMSKFMSRHY